MGRFRFSLSTLFVVITLIAVWLGWTANYVHQRFVARQWIREHGGVIRFVNSRTEGPVSRDEDGKMLPIPIFDDAGEPTRIPRVRQWFGDEAVRTILLTKEDHVQRMRELFPEAAVSSAPGWYVKSLE